MNNRILTLVTTAALVLPFGYVLFRANTAKGQEQRTSANFRAAADATANTTYEARLAANDAAAERWRAAHGDGTVIEPDALDDQATRANAGCPEGTQYWRRDRITELCAPLCTGDQDCGPEDGRCRLLDVEEREEAAPIVLVDDTPVEELEAVELDETKQVPPVRVCDPFWDVEGALDADLNAAAD